MQVLFQNFLTEFCTFFKAQYTVFKGLAAAPQYIVPGVSHLVPGGAVCVFGEDTLSLRFASSGIRLCRAKPANRRKPAAHIVSAEYTQTPPFLNNLRRRKNVLWREKQRIEPAAYK
jgi:hypothetical protein